MALIYRAQLRPTKQELISAWLPAQPWFEAGDPGALELLGAYRFDDPDDAVGLETHLVSVGGTVYQVPLAYRGSELPGEQESLVGTMEHSVLGRRWVYDAFAEPTYADALLTALMAGPAQAEQFLDVDGRREPLPPTLDIARRGPTVDPVPHLGRLAPVTTGSTTTLGSTDVTVSVPRVLDLSGHIGGEWALTGQWDGAGRPVQLASLVREGT
jgi:hypothetical protein